MKTLTILLTDGPYICQYADMAYKIANAALKSYNVNIFLYLDALHIPRLGQSPQQFPNSELLFLNLAERGAKIRACPRCAMARGYHPEKTKDYPESIRITSLYDLQKMIEQSDKAICISR